MSHTKIAIAKPFEGAPKINMCDHYGASPGKQILLKIPMQMDNEMESQYSIADIEIGPVTVVGIYRGKYNAGTIRKRVDTLSSFSKKNEMSEMETADEVDASGFDTEAKMHYIDVIAVIQELSF